MESVSDIIAAMCAVAPEGRVHLNSQEISKLRSLTNSLLLADPGAKAEYDRYLAIRNRSLKLPELAVTSWIKGKKVLVTGGTGCVGSTLISQLAGLRPQRLVSISRGVTRTWPRTTGVEYLHADVRDRPTLASIISDVEPDVLFHLAAQRDPGLAETTVRKTVTTNVVGTYNVIDTAERALVPLVVLASTGKAVVPYTPDVYASSKRIAEWLASNASGRGDILLAAARFTHLVDNSIVHDRIVEGCRSGVIRLHGPRGSFYVQSALESAQLLICAGIGPKAGSLEIHAISDLGWPVDLLSLALGALSRTGSDSAIYFSGHDRGYRSNQPFPGQYDPHFSWEFSPLLNAFEGGVARKAEYGHVDVFPRKTVTDSKLQDNFQALREACAASEDDEEIRGTLEEFSWAVFDATLGASPYETLRRVHELSVAGGKQVSSSHSRILDAIKSHAVAARDASIES